jgi:hypothetical protein
MFVKGTVRIGKDGLKLYEFEKTGNCLVSGTVFGLSALGLGLPQKLIVEGTSARPLANLGPGTHLEIEGEQYQETWKSTDGKQNYRPVVKASVVRLASVDINVNGSAAEVSLEPAT